MIAWAIVAGALLVSGLLAIRSANLVHAVLWLGAMLAATAAAFVMLGAPFVAGIQLLLYVGGVIVLLIFGVLLTGRHAAGPPQNLGSGKLRAGLTAGGLFAVMAYAILKGGPLAASPIAITTDVLGKDLFGSHVVAFEVLSFLLLAAMLGAIVLGRRRDPGERHAKREEPRP